jgi:peroxiredoxin
MRGGRIGVMKWLAVAVLAAAPLFAGTAVEQAKVRFDAAVVKVQGAVGAEFQALGCEALKRSGCEMPARARQTAAAATPAAAAIRGKMKPFRSLPTDADRARLVIEVASEIRALPNRPEKLSLARGVCSGVTEGELGHAALSAAADALAEGIKGTTARADAYIELASLVRYEHVAKPMEGPALDAALALLELREALHQEAGFSLTSLDGKTYSLDGLRGKVVLLNFWATWCPPCRKEMPDMQKLYTELAPKGFVVLAVSDEKRDVVEKFLADKNYTFPVLLDDGRKVHESFDVEGIPKSFLFNREGKIVGQAIDMRTERQFREMLKAAGL